MVTEHLLITVTSCIVLTMRENRFLLFTNHLRLPYSIPKSFALLLAFHTARHTFASTVTLANNVSLIVVSKMLGHSNVRMTEHYAKLVDNCIAEEMDKLMGNYSEE